MGVTALAFASGYFQQFLYPGIPLTPWGDQVMWLGNGIRMLEGRLPYRDYFQFTTPGCDLFYALMVKIWGARAWIPDLTMVAIGALAALLITLIARRVLSGTAALIPALLFIGFVLPNSLYATHHWFTALAVLAATNAMLDEATIGRAAAAGALCGVAACFTQSKAVIVAAVFLIFIFLRREAAESRRQVWREVAALCGGFAIVFIAVNAYFIRAAGISTYLFWTFIFPLRYFSAGKPFNTFRIYGNGLGSNMGVLRTVGFLFTHALVPLIYVVFFVQVFRRRVEGEKKDALLLIALVGVALSLAIASAPSPLRIFTVSPPALILLVCTAREGRMANVVIGLSAGLALLVAILAPIRFQTHWHAFLDTPSGRIAFLEPDRFELFQWAKAETHPGEMFFGNAPVCFALGLNNPTPLDYTTTDDFTRPALVADVVRDLETDRVPLILLLSGEYLPPPKDDATDHARPFREYLFRNYQLERRFETGDEAWIRRERGIENAEIQPHP